MKPFPGKLLCSILLTAAIGCDPGVELLSKVTGKVTFRGMPVGTGSIVFTPDASRGASGPQARADIQTDGTYSLRTGDRLGAPPGWYRVTIASVESVPQAGPGQLIQVPRSLLPEKYRDPQLSGLVREVKALDENKIAFDLD